MNLRDCAALLYFKKQLIQIHQKFTRIMSLYVKNITFCYYFLSFAPKRTLTWKMFWLLISTFVRMGCIH